MVDGERLALERALGSLCLCQLLTEALDQVGFISGEQADKPYPVECFSKKLTNAQRNQGTRRSLSTPVARSIASVRIRDGVEINATNGSLHATSVL